MRVDLFDFELPEERIALRPAVPRDAARLLVVDPSKSVDARFDDRQVGELADMLQPGDALVFNDTKVIPAQLEGSRHRSGPEGELVLPVSATLHMRAGSDAWHAFIKPGRRVKEGDRIRFGENGSVCFLGTLDCTVVEKGEDGAFLLRFDLDGPLLDEAIMAAGHMPLPPYIASKRPEDAQDQVDYQTVYAREHGAVAAPTAGLHFTDAVFANLEARGIERHFVTLHVGAGTFLPVKADDTADHRMHSEIGYVSAQTAEALNEVRRRGGRVIAVGTTSLRLLESAAGDDDVIRPWSGATDIFITPGYRFRAVDMLMTNFHLPKSTLFMLVSAFSGLETMRAAYAHAIAEGYRFYSYGDASLLKKAGA